MDGAKRTHLIHRLGRALRRDDGQAPHNLPGWVDPGRGWGACVFELGQMDASRVGGEMKRKILISERFARPTPEEKSIEHLLADALTERQP
jgi:hypothetical protein